MSRAGFYRPPIKFFSSLLLPENFSVDSGVFLLASNASSRIMFSKPAELRPADRRNVRTGPATVFDADFGDLAARMTYDF